MGLGTSNKSRISGMRGKTSGTFLLDGDDVVCAPDVDGAVE